MIERKKYKNVITFVNRKNFTAETVVIKTNELSKGMRKFNFSLKIYRQIINDNF